jgi:hypothetical protein
MAEGIDSTAPHEQDKPRAEAPAKRMPVLTKRRWGYVVWGVALAFVFIPEILAAIPLTESQLPFPTISRMTGHLEYQHAEWEIAPTALIVFVLLSLLRIPPSEAGAHNEERVAERANEGDVTPHRGPDGRITVAPTSQSAEEFDNSAAVPHGRRSVVWFVLRTVGVAILIALITVWAYHRWPNEYVGSGDSRKKLPNYDVAYFLYGSIGFFWLLLPSLTSFIGGARADHPSLFRTVINLEQWLAKPRGSLWSAKVGKTAAWLVSFVLVWGMVFLMLHLTLYPFPNITHILNHSG